MDEFKEFLGTSTIAGLSYISTSKRTAKLFWILVVFSTFTASFVEIWNLFQDWEKNPIKTTSKNLPISQLTLPNITVCPPKNSYLNLNYDIVKSEEVIIDNDTRQELLEYAIEVVQDALHAEMMKNLSILEDPDRFINWYRGYTRIVYPYFLEGRYETGTIVKGSDGTYTTTYDNQLLYDIFSSALSGNISTQYFGENLDEKKVERDIAFRINVYPPKSVKGDAKAAMILKVQKISVQDNEKEAEMKLNGWASLLNSLTDWSVKLNEDMFQFKDNDEYMFQVSLHRKLTEYDILNTKQKKMPGFIFSWNYDINVEPWAKFRENLISKHFVRYMFFSAICQVSKYQGCIFCPKTL